MIAMQEHHSCCPCTALPRLIFFVTSSSPSEAAVFPEATVAEMHDCRATAPPWMSARFGRLGEEDISLALSSLPRPLRVVICGPLSFNEEVRAMVARNKIQPEWITVLKS